MKTSLIGLILCYGQLFAANIPIDVAKTIDSFTVRDWGQAIYHDRFLTMLHAIKDGDIAAIDQELLEIINEEIKQNVQATPLSEALKYCKKDATDARIALLKFLIEKQRLDIFLLNNMSYLHLAIEAELPDIAELLINEIIKRYGASSNLLDIRAWRGHTPLHFACALHDMRTIEALINAGAELAPKDHRDRSPLHFLYDPECLQGCPNALDLKKYSLSAVRWPSFKIKMDQIINLFKQRDIVLPLETLDRDVQIFWDILENWDQKVRDQQITSKKEPRLVH